MNITKAVFPAAGLGTRILPATKAIPKEMIPLIDKPLIQYGVEEAINSGLSHIILITSRGKSCIEDHFDMSYELERTLADRGKHELLKEVQAVSHLAEMTYVRQKEPLGIGHAILAAREVIGNEPFACFLGDDIIESEVPCIKQLLDVFREKEHPVIAIEEIPEKYISAYGVIAGEKVGENLYRITDMIEKPPAGKAPSNLAIIGRYVLTPDLIELLKKVEPDAKGEIQLTNGLKMLLKQRPIFGYKFQGKRYDAGNKLGYLKATVELALKRKDLGPAFREFLRSLNI